MDENPNVTANENVPALKNYTAKPKTSGEQNATALKSYTVKPLFTRKPADAIMALCLAIISIFGVSALFWDELRLGYTIVFDLSVIIISAFLMKKGQEPRPAFLICGVLSIICSWSFAVTSAEAVKVVTLFATALSAVIWFASVSGKEYKKGDFSLIAYALQTVYRAFSDITGVFKGLFSKSENKSKTVSNILIGVACAIPAVLIIVPLLARADAAFGTIVYGLFDDYFTLLQKIILGLGASVFLITGVFSLKYNNQTDERKELGVKANTASLSAFLCVLCSVYLVYLFSQLAYFFSAFSNILPKGYKFTYAGYARRGFFELCIISLINLLIIFAAVLLADKKDGKIPLAVRLPAAFTVLFTMVIIATAISKMVMYISAYSLTVLRVLTSAFMIWMGVLFIFLFLRLFSKRSDILTVGLIFALIILAVLGLGNVNRQIAMYNYNAYISGKTDKRIDVEYIAELGDEGIPYLYNLANDKNEDVATRAKLELSYKYNVYYKLGKKSLEDIDSYNKFEKLEKTWQSIGKYSLAKSKAYTVLEKYAKEQDGKVYMDAEYGD